MPPSSEVVLPVSTPVASRSVAWVAGGKPRVLVLGGGFAGLAACRELRHVDCEIVLVDRQNHHLFQPLLYQVATAGLSGSDIAQPLRSIVADQPNVEVHMATVRAIDLTRREVSFQEDPRPVPYDHLVIAMGVATNWFGHPEWSRHAIGLKTLADANLIRDRLLHAAELAENMFEDSPERRRLLTTVVVGGGATGVEMAGAIAELGRRAIEAEFRVLRPNQLRVILIDGGDRLLPTFPEALSARTLRDLTSMGVDVRLRARVESVEDRAVLLPGERLEAQTIVWAAGVVAPAFTRSMGVPIDRAGRFIVGPDCRLPGHPEVLVAGDIAALTDAAGTLVPGVAQGAMQAGRFVGRSIRASLTRHGSASSRAPGFRYRDKGSMATIGRRRAVAQIGSLEFAGVLAWLLWLSIHLLFLVDLRSRLSVLLKWFAAYLWFKPSNRVIIARPSDDLQPDPTPRTTPSPTSA